MGERESLLEAVLDQPEDDNARLVFSDWLEEHGEPDLGQFLRAGVVAGRYRAARVIEDHAFYDALAAIADVAAAGAPGRWVAALGLGSSPAVGGDWAWDNVGDRVTVRSGDTTGEFSRGMLDGLGVTLGEWYAVAAAAVSSWPVGRVSVRDAPGVSFWFDPPGDHGSVWRVTASLTVQPRRSRGLLPQVFGPRADEVPPVAPVRWRAEATFPTRKDMVGRIDLVLPALVTELRGKAGNAWPHPR